MADESAYASVTDLTDKDAIVSEDFETITGRKIRVRGLSRTEHLKLRTQEVDFEAHTLSACLVIPAMTVKQAKAWMDKAPAGEITGVTSKISELSALDENAGKAAYKSIRGESGA